MSAKTGSVQLLYYNHSRVSHVGRLDCAVSIQRAPEPWTFVISALNLTKKGLSWKCGGGVEAMFGESKQLTYAKGCIQHLPSSPAHQFRTSCHPQVRNTLRREQFVEAHIQQSGFATFDSFEQNEDFIGYTRVRPALKHITSSSSSFYIHNRNLLPLLYCPSHPALCIFMYLCRLGLHKREYRKRRLNRAVDL